MIKEIKKTYSIHLVKFDGANQDELVEFSGATDYQYFNDTFILNKINSGIIKRSICIPIGHYLVKDEENGSIYTVSNIKSIADNVKRGEISIEDEDLIKEFVAAYKQLEDQIWRNQKQL